MEISSSPDRKEATMATDSETQVREFASHFDTPNVRLMVQLCEAGRISWAEAADIARQSLAKGLGAVA
jgi:hypothetical protein